VVSAQSTEKNKWTGGLWIRMSGGQNDVKSTAADTLTAVGITETASLKIATRFEGFQTGYDSGWLNVDGTGWNLHGGVTAGDINASSTSIGTPGFSVGPGGVTAGIGPSNFGSMKFSVPFVGVYGVATHGNFFADLTVRHDFLNLRVTDTAAGFNDTRFDGHANNVNTSAGYHYDLGQNWFFEPSLGFSYTQSKFDSLPLLTAGTLAFDTVTSELGRAGARIGTAFQPNASLILSPFVTGTVWHEFAGPSTSTATLASTIIPVSATRVGTFYQASAGISGQLVDTGLLGFVRGDARFGENLSGWSLLGGGRYTW
jgi:outer membrane autotransporter protein